MGAIPRMGDTMSGSVGATKTAYDQIANSRDAAVKEYQGVKEGVDNAASDGGTAAAAIKAEYQKNDQKVAIMSNDMTVPPKSGSVDVPVE